MYKKEKENTIEDTVSRRDGEQMLNAIFMVEHIWVIEIKDSYDDDMKKLRDDIKQKLSNYKCTQI